MFNFRESFMVVLVVFLSARVHKPGVHSESLFWNPVSGAEPPRLLTMVVML